MTDEVIRLLNRILDELRKLRELQEQRHRPDSAGVLVASEDHAVDEFVQALNDRRAL